MALGSGDLLGMRGERIAELRLTDFCGNALPYFAAHFLGDKFPTYDLLVELVGVAGSRPYFFAQVKSTRKVGGTARAGIRARIESADVEAMVACPIPTYVIGVDEPGEEAYILAIDGSRTGPISTIPRKYPLGPANLKILYDEIRGYWGTLAGAAKTKASAFSS
ncbi:DUF4365 domain-containing protein [Singulisphaera rosea]